MFREKFTVSSFIFPKITEVLNLVSMKKKVNHFQQKVIFNFFHGIFLKSLNPKNGIKTMVFPWLTSHLPW